MRTHLPAFLLSALIHLGLLAFFLVGVSLLPHVGSPETRVAVTLQMFQPPPAPPAPAVTEPVVEQPPEPVVEPPPPPLPEPKPPEPKPKPKPKSKPKPPVPKPTPKPPTPKPRPPVPEVAPQPMPEAPVSTAAQPVNETTAAVRPAADVSLLRRVEEAYKIALRKAIESHKVYPRRAARLHQEGEILVAFSVRRDGGIVGLRVAESSGSALLDRAALEAVREVDGTLPFPREIERSVWAFTLPISYTLR